MRRLILAAGLAAVACGPDDDVEPPPPAPESCEVPLKGRADTSEAVRDASGIWHYDYTVEQGPSSFTIGLVGADGASLGTVDITERRTMGGVVPGEETNRFIGTAIATLTTPSGQTSRVTISHEGNTREFQGRISVRPPRQLIRVEHGGRTLYIQHDLREGGVAVLYAPISEVAAPPSVGHTGRLVFSRSRGPFDFADSYILPVLDEAEANTWLREIGLESWAGDEDLARLMLTTGDPTWAIEVGAHVERCVQATTTSTTGLVGTTTRGIAIKSCLSSLTRLSGSVFFIAGAAALVTSGPPGWVAIALGGAGGAAVLTLGALAGIEALECYCTNEGKRFVRCVECDQSECSYECFANSPECGYQFFADGQCRNVNRDSYVVNVCVCVDQRRYKECPNSVADPHITTFRQARYSLQSAGEFVLAESTSGAPFVVQVRQEPYRGGLCAAVAVNTALATRFGDRRVGLYFDNPDLRVVVDDVEIDIPEGENRLIGDGLVERLGRQRILLTYADGSSVEMRRYSIYLDLTEALAARVHGLIGVTDPMDPDDLVLRNGTRVPAPLDWDDLHSTFADAWRIGAAESLFTYEPGEDTTTFTIDGFPDRYQEPSALPEAERTAARETCEAAGIVDRVGLEDCILDVVCTGDPSVAEEHQSSEDVRRIPIRTPIGLETWAQAGTEAADWTLGANRARLTRNDADGPIFLLRPFDDSTVRIEGRFNVNSAAVGYAGFVFGLRSPTSTPSLDLDTFLLSWKGGGDTEIDGVTAREGITLARVNGSYGTDVGFEQLWGQQSSPNYEVLDAEYAAGLGFDGDYDFTIVYAADRIEARIDRPDGSPVYSVAIAPPNGETFAPGRLGLYALRQTWVGISNVELTRF